MKRFNSSLIARKQARHSIHAASPRWQQALRLLVLAPTAAGFLLFAQLYAARAVWQVGVPYVRGNRSQRRMAGNSRTGTEHSKVRHQTDAPSARLQVRMSSVMLCQCWQVLTRSEEERMLVMTGIRSGDMWVITSFEEVEYLHASPVRVIAAPQATHRILQRYDDRGHVLLAVFHAHPGTGQWSATESHLDREAQRRYEQAGYSSFSGILTRDGFLRVFTHSLDFHLSVYGKGIETLGHGYYRLHVP